MIGRLILTHTKRPATPTSLARRLSTLRWVRSLIAIPRRKSRAKTRLRSHWAGVALQLRDETFAR